MLSMFISLTLHCLDLSYHFPKSRTLDLTIVEWTIILQNWSFGHQFGEAQLCLLGEIEYSKFWTLNVILDWFQSHAWPAIACPDGVQVCYEMWYEWWSWMYMLRVQVVISYIDQLDTTSDRHSQLERCYYFTCHCDSCRDTDNVCNTNIDIWFMHFVFFVCSFWILQLTILLTVAVRTVRFSHYYAVQHGDISK